jgi:hypothetical protein
MQPNFRMLFPIPAGLAAECIVDSGDAIEVTARAEARVVRCPFCGSPSRRIHSRYVRKVSDLPCSGRVPFALSCVAFAARPRTAEDASSRSVSAGAGNAKRTGRSPAGGVDVAGARERGRGRIQAHGRPEPWQFWRRHRVEDLRRSAGQPRRALSLPLPISGSVTKRIRESPQERGGNLHISPVYSGTSINPAGTIGPWRRRSFNMQLRSCFSNRAGLNRPSSSSLPAPLIRAKS